MGLGVMLVSNAKQSVGCLRLQAEERPRWGKECAEGRDADCTPVRRGENVKVMREEEAEEGRTEDYCLQCKRILIWSHHTNPPEMTCKQERDRQLGGGQTETGQCKGTF